MKAISFDLGHITLAGFSNENHGKPLLLALHGWLDNAGSFEPMMPYLDNFHVIALDFPGHGLSPDRNPDAHYHFVEWVYDICRLINAQQWQRLCIVGHSMGGMVSQLVAAVLPEAISRIVLIDAIGLITTEAEDACEQLKQAVHSRERTRSRVKGVHANLEQALTARLTAGDIGMAQAKTLAKRGLLENPQGYTWRSDPRLRTHSAMRLTFEQAKSFMKAIECPVLLIRGKDGGEMVSKQLARYQDLFIELRVVEIDGGHHCHMQHPVDAARLVAEFVGMA